MRKPLAVWIGRRGQSPPLPGSSGSSTKARSWDWASSSFATLRGMSVDDLDSLLERLPRHHLFADIPAELRGWLLPIAWDRGRLWALDLPQRRVELGELRWHLDLPWWRHDDVWFHVTPREFLAHPTAHPEHADRVAKADLSYPLHVIRRHDRWLILDGIHRLVRAEMLGLSDISVATLATADLARITR